MFLFGYVRPCKPQLLMGDYEIYQGFYCGLCRVSGQKYGIAARMLLNYDFVFLGMLEYGMNGESCTLKSCRCTVNPLKKTPCLCGDDILEYTAACECLLVYHKLCDDISDSGIFRKILSVILQLMLKKGYNKAAEKYPELAEYIAAQMKEQVRIECNKDASLDMAAEPSAKILGEIASYLGHDNDDKAYLRRFGYMLGRYIYISDAYDDYEKDIKRGDFNPLKRYGESMEDITRRTSECINLTLGAMSDAYVHLEIKRFKAILDNIVFIGLKSNFCNIVNSKSGKGKCTNERSL